MTNADRESFDQAELEQLEAEALPRREAMSVIGPVPGAVVDAAVESAADTVDVAAEADSETSRR